MFKQLNHSKLNLKSGIKKSTQFDPSQVKWEGFFYAIKCFAFFKCETFQLKQFELLGHSWPILQIAPPEELHHAKLLIS